MFRIGVSSFFFIFVLHTLPFTAVIIGDKEAKKKPNKIDWTHISSTLDWLEHCTNAKPAYPSRVPILQCKMKFNDGLNAANGKIRPFRRMRIIYQSHGTGYYRIPSFLLLIRLVFCGRWRAGEVALVAGYRGIAHAINKTNKMMEKRKKKKRQQQWITTTGIDRLALN